MENKLDSKDIVETKADVINCGEAKILDTVTYEKDGKMVTEEILELKDLEGRASTITIRHTAGVHNLDVTFSASGHGTNVWCEYAVGSKDPMNGGGFLMKWNSATYAKDVERRFSKVNVDYPPKPSGQGNNFHYLFVKEIYSSSTQAKPIRVYEWTRFLSGTGTTK